MRKGNVDDHLEGTSSTDSAPSDDVEGAKGFGDFYFGGEGDPR